MGHSADQEEERGGGRRVCPRSPPAVRSEQHISGERRVPRRSKGQPHCGGGEQRFDAVHDRLADSPGLSQLVHASVGETTGIDCRYKGELLLGMRGDCVLWNLEIQSDDPLFDVGGERASRLDQASEAGGTRTARLRTILSAA